MTDETARVSGVFGGVKRHSATTTATAPTTFTAPIACDPASGFNDLRMEGNDEWGNCFFVGGLNAVTLQSFSALDPNGKATYVPGFTPYADDQAVAWYKAYLESQGQPATPPGNGTDITSGTAWLLANVDDIEAVGVIAGGPNGEFDSHVVREAIWDTQGGAIVCWALDPMAQQEFEDHQCWGAQSANPDYEDGHATDGASYDQLGITVATWAQFECTTDLADANCIDGLVLIVSKGLRAKLGDSYVDQVIAKWGLTTKAATAPANDVPAGGVDTVLHDIEHDVEVAWDHVEHFIKPLQKIIEEAVQREGVDAVMQVLTLIRRSLRP